MTREQILAVLYDMAIVIGGEIRLRPLLVKTLQRFLFHTSFPCGLVFLDSVKARSPDSQGSLQARLELSIGDFELAQLNGTSVRVSAELLQGPADLAENPALLDQLPCRKDHYRVYLRLPIDDCGVILLMSPDRPANADVPLTRIFQPVLSNLAKSILLCQSNEAYTQSIIAERRVVEAAFEDLSYRNQLILDSLGEGICDLDEHGNATFVNPAAVRMLGFQPGELVGRSFHEIVLHQRADGSLIPEPECPILQAIRKGSQYRVAEDVFQRKDGTTFPVEYACTPLRDPHRIVGAVIVFQDITERKQAEADIRQLASIVESSDDAIIGKALDGSILSWNRGAEEIYGYRADEAKGRSISILVPPDYPDDVDQILGKVKRGEHIEHYETLRRRKDGQDLYVSLTVSPVKDAAGALVGASAITRDITDRKKAEEGVRRASVYNRSLIEASLDPLVTIGPSGAVTDVNAATEAITGCTRSELIGTDFSDYFTEPAKARAGYQQVFREGTVRDYALEIRHRNGDTTAVLYNASLYRDEAGNPSGVFAAARDITERKRMEDSLQEQKRFAESLIANSGVATFVLDPAHKVKLWNLACEELTGFKAADMIGGRGQWKPFYDHERPTLADIVIDGRLDRMGELYENWSPSSLIKQGLQSERWCPNMNGHSRYVFFEAVPIFTSKGELSVVIETLHDMTARKLAENDLKSLNRALLTLSTCNMTLIHAREEERLTEDICKAVVEVGDYSMVWVGYAERNERRTIRPVAFAGREEGYLEALPLTWDEGCGCPAGMAIKTGVPFIAQNIATLADETPWRAEALGRKYAACIALPLHFNHEVIGVLNIYAGDADAFNEDELRLLTELADDLSYGIVTLRTRAERDRAIEERQRYLEKIRKVMEDTVQAIAAILEMRDPYITGHQRRVAQLAEAISRELGLAPQTIEGIHFGCLIHDIGKIYVPAEFLSRPGRLLDLEFNLIKTHPQVGYDLVKDIEFPWPVAEMIHQHHEHIDGSGYPQGLKGEDIIIEARVLVVADVVEAMASHRPYRPARGIDTALEEVLQNRGILYDATVVDACVRLFREGRFAFQ